MELILKCPKAVNAQSNFCLYQERNAARVKANAVVATALSFRFLSTNSARRMESAAVTRFAMDCPPSVHLHRTNLMEQSVMETLK